MTTIGSARLQILGVGGFGGRLVADGLVRLLAEVGSAADSPFLSTLPSGMVVASALFVDPDPVEGGRIPARLAGGALAFHPESLKVGAAGASRIYGRGVGPLADALLPRVLDGVRRGVDSGHDDGFVLVHALGGGSGSGFAVALARALRADYPKRSIISVALLPSPSIDGSPLDVVNAGLGLAALVEPADAVILVDNDAAAGGGGRSAAERSPALEMTRRRRRRPRTVTVRCQGCSMCAQVTKIL